MTIAIVIATIAMPTSSEPMSCRRARAHERNSPAELAQVTASSVKTLMPSSGSARPSPRPRRTTATFSVRIASNAVPAIA